MEKKIIASIQKTETEAVQVSIGTYKEKTYLDIRVFFKFEGDWKPTKKGITLAADLLPELASAIQSTQEALTVTE